MKGYFLNTNIFLVNSIKLPIPIKILPIIQQATISPIIIAVMTPTIWNILYNIIAFINFSQI